MEYVFLLYRDDNESSEPMKVCQDIEACVHFLRTDKSVKKVTYTKVQVLEDDKEVSFIYKIKVMHDNIVTSDVNYYILSREEIYNEK